MKTLLQSLAVIAALASSAWAASTTTVHVPVEQKVVEIHMSSVQPEPTPEIRRRGRKQILPLRAGTCSGSFVSSNGDILTARHCVDGFDEFLVQTYDYRVYRAVVVATSTIHDLAIIHIDKRNTPFFELANSVVRGQQIYVLGSPLGITDTLSTGVIARLDGDVTLLDCSALPGNSGGPVYDKQERLVGVLNAGYIVMFGVTHLNQAQGLDAVHYFLQDVLENRNGRR